MNPYVAMAWETLKAHPGEWYSMDALVNGLIPPVTCREDYVERIKIHSAVSHYLSKYTGIGWIEKKKIGRRTMWRWAE